MTDELDITAREAEDHDLDRQDAIVELVEDAEQAIQRARETLQEAAEAVPSASVARKLRAYEAVFEDPQVFCRRMAGSYRAHQQPYTKDGS